MKKFTKFEISNNNKSVKLGVGLRLHIVEEKLQNFGLFTIHGICSGVGVGGHYQSSGYGSIGRSFGLGLDNINSFNIILANASILYNVTNITHPYLFFGVVGGNVKYSIFCLRILRFFSFFGKPVKKILERN